MKNFIRAFLISISTSLCLVAQVQFVIAQTASILPQAETQFLDNNGKPVTSGTVDFYIPNSSTRKSTWQDAGMSVSNTNPVKLDASGRALIYGYGGYRQVLKDRNGNLIWDRVTNSYSIPNGQVTSGDGNNVGTILQWSALTAPNQYVFAYGQELARVTYPELLAAITLVQNVNCTSSSNSLSGIADTSQIPIGASIEASCFAASVTVTGKTSNTYTVSANATVTTTVQATVFPFGNGNATSTFNVPDLRGRVLAGRDNMGGIAASRLTTAYFANASAIGATGGIQDQTIVTNNLPPYTPAGSVANGTLSTGLSGSGGSNTAASPGGIAVGTSLASLNGATVVSGAFTGTAQGGTSTPFSIVQPTITINYIIKVTPDQTGLVAAGVQSIQAMGGIITCDSSLLCAGQIIGLSNQSNNTLLANTSGISAKAISTTLSAFLDSAASSAQGSILYRNASAWTALAPGNAGYLLATQGAGQNPVWAAPLGPPVSIQAPNTVYAGPTTGAPNTPAFRSLVTADIPLPIISSNAHGVEITAGPASGGPIIIPDKSQPTTGIGGAPGNVSIIADGLPVLNVASVAGATVSTPNWQDGTNRIATAHYADVAAGVICTNSGSSGATFTLQLACPNITEPFNDNQVIIFQSPISGAVFFKLAGGSGTGYQIWDAGMTGILVAEATSQSFDIKQGGRYALRYSASGGVWQLITPPKSYTETTPPVTYTYFQNGTTKTSVDGIFNFEVYNVNKGWITQYGGVNQELFNNTATIDGVVNQSLTVGKGYHAYIICTGTCSSIADVKIDFVSRYFDGATASAAFNATITGTSLAIDGGAVIPPCGLDICGTVQIGQVISGPGVKPGTSIVSGSGTSWVVNFSQSVGYATLTGSPAKYFNQAAAPGRPIFVDAAGNYGEYLGMVFARSNTNNDSLFTREAAVGIGQVVGINTMSSPFSVYPRQPLTVVTNAQMTGTVPTPTLAELDTRFRTNWAGHEWEPVSDFRTNGSYQCPAQGTIVRLQVRATDLTRGSVTVMFDQTRTCPGIGDLPWEVTASWPFSDSFQQFTLYGSSSAGATGFSFQPQQKVSY